MASPAGSLRRCPQGRPAPLPRRAAFRAHGRRKPLRPEPHLPPAEPLAASGGLILQLPG